MFYRKSRSARAFFGSAASTLVIGALLQAAVVTSASAQDAAAEEETEVEEVVVTGTFLRGTPETAAIPVEGVNLEELRDKGSPSNLEFIKSLSEVGSVAGEANRNNGFAIGAQAVNLRSLSSSRTVVVFNGRRFPEQYSFTVGRFNNVAQIPNAAIGRVEVLKDGGATTYGADAIGGVINYITRRNLDGIEARASYTYIDGSDGDYDASISVGKVFDNFNVMGVLGYIKRSELDLVERDWALKDYLHNPASWNGGGNPGAYAFQTTTNNLANGGTTISPTMLALAGGNRQISSTGVMRDPACAALGGFAGWSSTPSPVCYQQTGPRQNLIEEQETWQGYAEANYEFSPRFRVHGEYMYYGLDIPHIPIDNGGGLVNNFPLARDTVTGALLTNSSGQYRTQTYGVASTPAYFVPGSNPYVLPFLNTFTNSNGTQTFGNPATPGTLAYQIVNGGRVALPSGTWRPFGVGGNPDPYDFQHNFSNQHRYTLEFSGDLGKFAGGTWDWEAAYTLNTLDYTLAFYDIPVDRLQAALNGLGGANCTGSVAGANGCQWFNPFSSAIASNIYTGQQNTVTYAPGRENSADLVSWLYVPQSMVRRSDYMIFDVLLRGDLDYHLWSEDPISLAVGAQYRELNETSDLSDLADESINGCATPMVTNCATRQGGLVHRRGANVSGFVRDYDRRYPVESAFGEVRIPVTDSFSVQLSTRWEKFFSDLEAADNEVNVSQIAARWQATPWLAFRGTAGETFSNANPPAPAAAIVNGNTALSSDYCTGGCGGQLYTSANYSNTEVRPETGSNWNVGAIVEVGDFTATVDYYSIEINDILIGLSAANVLRAATVPGGTGDATYFDCASPLITRADPRLGDQPFVQLTGACVQGTSTVRNSVSRVNFFGAQGQQTALFNGPSVETTGLDVGVKWRQSEVLGGDLTVEADASYILSYDVSDFQVGGYTISPGYDAVGLQNNGDGRFVSQRINNWRGSMTLNYSTGRHNFNWSTRFVSSILNTDATLFQAAPQYNANIGDSAGMPIACPTSPLVSTPVPANDGTANFGAFQSCQNVTVAAGHKVPSFFTSDFTYRVALPADTNVSLTVNNVFDEDPSFSRDIINYDAYSGSPLGRTFKISIAKQW